MRIVGDVDPVVQVFSVALAGVAPTAALVKVGDLPDRRRGEQLECVQIDNDPKALVKAVRAAGRGAQVAIEATYGWYWAVDALQAAKFDVYLAHPYGMKAMRKRKRVKTDAVDAYELANLLRLGSLPEGYIAPKDLRELRELVRHRRQLTKTETSVKAQIRALRGVG